MKHIVGAFSMLRLAAHPFSGKYFPVMAACILFSQLNAILKSPPNYVAS